MPNPPSCSERVSRVHFAGRSCCRGWQQEVGKRTCNILVFFFFLNFPSLGVEVCLKRNRPQLQGFILSVVLHRSVLFFHPQDAQGLDTISIIKTPPLYSRPRRPENFNRSSTIYPLKGEEKQQTNSTGALLHDTRLCLHPAPHFQGVRMGDEVWGEEKTLSMDRTRVHLLPLMPESSRSNSPGVPGPRYSLCIVGVTSLDVPQVSQGETRVAVQNPLPRRALGLPCGCGTKKYCKIFLVWIFSHAGRRHLPRGPRAAF